MGVNQEGACSMTLAYARWIVDQRCICFSQKSLHCLSCTLPNALNKQSSRGYHRKCV